MDLQFLPLVCTIITVSIATFTSFFAIWLKRRENIMREQMLNLYTPLYRFLMEDIIRKNNTPLDVDDDKLNIIRKLIKEQIHITPEEIIRGLLFNDKFSLLQYEALCSFVKNEFNNSRRQLGYPYYFDLHFFLYSKMAGLIFLIMLCVIAGAYTSLAFTNPEIFTDPNHLGKVVYYPLPVMAVIGFAIFLIPFAVCHKRKKLLKKINSYPSLS